MDINPLQQYKSHSKIIRLNAVVDKLGLSRSTLYNLMKTPDFPQKLKLSSRAIGFYEIEIDQWLESRARLSA